MPRGSLRRCCCLLICVIRVGNFSCSRVIQWLYQAIINLTASTRCKRREQHWVKSQKTQVVLWEGPGQQWTLRQHRCTSVLESLKRFLGRVTSSTLVLLYISVPWLLRPWCRRESGRAALGFMTRDPPQDTLWYHVCDKAFLIRISNSLSVPALLTTLVEFTAFYAEVLQKRKMLLVGTRRRGGSSGYATRIAVRLGGIPCPLQAAPWSKWTTVAKYLRQKLISRLLSCMSA